MLRDGLDRRAAFLALVCAVAAGPSPAATPTESLSPADSRDVARVVNYLQGLTTAESRFVQTDARGGRSEGTFYLQRPGKARFDYDPPSGLAIASDGRQVTVVDRRLKTIHVYPLGLTPLALFLARDIRLDRGVIVRQVTRSRDGFTVVAEDGRRKTRGQIALNFSAAPLALTGWTVTDARGAVVAVRLAGLARTEPRAAGFFRLRDPRSSRSLDAED